jgi:hypothetical protein
MSKEVQELKEKLLNCTRTESRWIKDRINKIEREQYKLEDTLYKFDNDIRKM